GRGPAVPSLQRSRRSDQARHGRPARGGRCHRRGTRQSLRRLRPGGVQAHQGAGRRRPGEPEQGRPAASVPSRSGGLRPDDEVDRAVPPTGPGALRPPGRRPGRDAGRRTTHHPPATKARSSVM
ncbi:MAG: Transcriptional regulator, ArsR family, partial [uncultured Acidimicrobiales bacterium]